MTLGQQASAEGMAVEGAEDEGEAYLAATTSMEAAGVADTAATTRATDAVADDSTASATIVTRADICGAFSSSSLMDGPLLKDKRVDEQEEGEEEAVEAVAVAEVAMFKGADGKRVSLKNVLWVPNLAANLISVRRLQKAGMDTSSKGAKTYTARLGKRILWDLHKDRDVCNETWQIPVVPMPKERQVAGEPDEVLGCPTCMQAKFTRYPFSSSEATAKAPPDEVVMDVMGPLKLGAAGGEYFLTIVDVYTRMTWVYVLSKKIDVAETVKTDWLPMVERQQDRACVAKNRALTHVGAEKWVPYVEWIGRKPNVDMLRVFGCMCMALVPKHFRHNKLGAKAIWAVHLGMAQNSKGWLLWDPFTKKLLVSRDCKFMENLMYKDWKAENEAKIGMRFGEVKSSGLEHVELLLELSRSTITTKQSSLVNGGEEAKDAEEEEEEVQQVSERAPTLPSRTTSAPRIRVTPQQRHESLHVPLKVGDDEESDYDECAFTFFSPVDLPGEPATLKEALESSDAEEWKKAMESEMKSIEENVSRPFVVGDTVALFHITVPWLLGFVGAGSHSQLVTLPNLCSKSIVAAIVPSFMVVYVDDILIFSPSSDLVKEVMLKLHDKFKWKALGDGPEEESVGEEERRRFHSLVGSLIYAAVNTRPEVAFATEQLARVVQCPNEERVAAGMRAAKYLGQTRTFGLQYLAAAQRRQKAADGVDPGRLFLTAFSDASNASKPEDMTSVGGFICCVGGGPTAWESKKQVDQALSSVESAYMALFRAVREIVWQRRLLAELGEEQQGPTPIYYDSQGAIALAKSPVLHGLTKHMRVKWHWTRSMVATGEVELRYVKTTGQPADMMTKKLVEQQHWKCCKLARMALN
ncbi:unnamed protein product [Closterium sp. NIES-53]